LSKKKFDLSKKLGNLEIKLVGYYEIQIKMITKIIKDSEKKKIIKKNEKQQCSSPVLAGFEPIT